MLVEFVNLVMAGYVCVLSILKERPLEPRQEKFKYLNAFDEMDAKIGGPRLFVCTFSRRSNSGGPPILKRRVNSVDETITQHELLWEMLMRKCGMSGRYSGNRLAVDDERVGSALPGTGPVVSALKAHANVLLVTVHYLLLMVLMDIL